MFPALFGGPPPLGRGGRALAVCTVARVTPAADLDQERLLCERARAGDRQALGSLLRTHGPRLYKSVLLPRLGSAAQAEEALSITYMKVVERFSQFEWQDVGIYPWLRVIGLRVALDMLRKRKREVLFEERDLEREVDAAEREAKSAAELEQADLHAARRRVEELLDQLNPRYAEAIRLRILGEKSREEAALALNVSVATFDVVLHRAMAALKKALAKSRTPSPSGAPESVEPKP